MDYHFFWSFDSLSLTRDLYTIISLQLDAASLRSYSNAGKKEQIDTLKNIDERIDGNGRAKNYKLSVLDCNPTLVSREKAAYVFAIILSQFVSMGIAYLK
jgi:hypothetical protein